jgi:hypothetical protein
MLITRVFEPGDATRYTVHYGLTRKGEGRHWDFFFAFGTGEDKGVWTQFDTRDIPNLSFYYFMSCMGYDNNKEYHTGQVAFTVFLSLIDSQRFESDSWERESDLNWSFMEDMPNLIQLLDGVQHA